MTESERPRLFVNKQDAPRFREAFGDGVFDGNFVVSKDVPRGTVYVTQADQGPWIDPDVSGTVDPEVIKRLMRKIAQGPDLKPERLPETHPWETRCADRITDV